MGSTIATSAEQHAVVGVEAEQMVAQPGTLKKARAAGWHRDVSPGASLAADLERGGDRHRVDGRRP